MLPFTAEQFFDVFGRYNTAIWPAQIAAYGLGMLAVLAAVLRGGQKASAIVVPILALFWAWTGVAYHWLAFTQINDAAWLFGAVFVLQAALLFWFGLARARLDWTFEFGAQSVVGLCFVVYAAILYPLIGVAAGHGYPRMPMFGVTPCPVTIFTLGLLLLPRSVPWPVLVVPVLWSLIGGSAAVLLQVPQDWLLLLSGPLSAALLWRARSVG